MLGVFQQILNPILSAFSSTPPGDTTIFDAIESGNLDEVKKIIEKNPLVLEQKDSDGNTPIFFAIFKKNKEIVEEIIEKDPWVLEQKDLDGDAPIFYAIFKKNKEIVEEIIGKYPWVLEQKDSYGDTPIGYTALMPVMSSGRDNEDEVSKILQTILEHQFPGLIIDKASQEDVKELFLKKMLLKGIYSEEKAPFYFECLEKAFDKITPENTFNKIYQDLFKNVDKNQPINLKNNEKMYIFQSNLEEHSSFFIFHVNKANELTSISYCDGNKIDEGGKIEGSTTHINGVTTFHLKTPIEYDNDFAKNFINENTQDKSHKVFYDKFREKKLYFKGSHIEFSEITHSIPTKIQIRGNCAFKSPSLAVRFISHQQNPENMVYGFDPKTQEPTGNGHHEYKEFKANLTKNALVSTMEIKEKISSKPDLLSDYLRKKIEDTMKIVGVHNKRKLIPIPEEKSNEFKRAKRRKLSTKGIHNEIAAILNSNESPNESLSPLTNQSSPLSTNMTDRSHK